VIADRDDDVVMLSARRLAVPAVIASEYVLGAAIAAGAMYLVISQPSGGCADTCASDGPLELAFVVFCCELVIVGLVASLIIASVRLRRGRRRGEAYPDRGQTIVSAATSAATRGLLWALAASPVLACTWLPLLRFIL
jgi:hypothetical protein